MHGMCTKITYQTQITRSQWMSFYLAQNRKLNF